MLFRNKWFNVLLLALLVVVFRFPSFDVPLDTDSSANAFIARQMLRGENLYDKYHTGHHLPGVYYTFLLAFKLFGDNTTAPALLLLPFIFVSAWLIYRIGSSSFDIRAGMLGTLFFLLLSSQRHLAGMTVEMELFALLPLTATIYLLIVLLRLNDTGYRFFWVGMFGAVSILYKITFVAPLMVSVISILLMAWLERDRVSSGKRLFLRLLYVALGLILPLALVGGYFAILGLWPRLMLVFTFGFTYFSDTKLMGGGTFLRPFGFPLFVMAFNNIVLLVFGLFGTIRLIRNAFPLKTVENLINLVIALWVIISFLLTGLRGGGFLHYALIVVPPLALTGGIEISLAFQRWQHTPYKRSAFLGMSVMVALVIINFFWSNNDLYHHYIQYKLGWISYDEFAYRYSKDNQRIIAEYLASHTSPDDYIYIWSINVQAYYLADRHPPVDILWPSYVSATGPAERIFDPRTKYIIMGDAKSFPRPQWLLNGLEQTYRLETTINEIEIYRRKTP